MENYVMCNCLKNIVLYAIYVYSMRYRKCSNFEMYSDMKSWYGMQCFITDRNNVFPIELEFVTKLKPQSIVMPSCTVSIIKNVVHNFTNITQQV